MAETHAEERLIKKPNSKSVVWNYSGLKANKHSIILPEEDLSVERERKLYQPRVVILQIC